MSLGNKKLQPICHFTFAKLCLPASWLEHFYLGGNCALNCGRNGVDGLHDFARDFDIGKFQPEIFLQGDHQLQGINRIQPQTVRPNKGWSSPISVALILSMQFSTTIFLIRALSSVESFIEK